MTSSKHLQAAVAVLAKSVYDNEFHEQEPRVSSQIIHHLELYVQSGGDLNAQDAHGPLRGNTFFLIACAFGLKHVVDFLFEKKADFELNRQSQSIIENVLCLFSPDYMYEMAQVLSHAFQCTDHAPQPDEPFPDPLRVLPAAMSAGHLCIFRCLAARGVSVVTYPSCHILHNFITKTRYEPITQAHVEILSYLLSKTEKVVLTESYKYTVCSPTLPSGHIAMSDTYSQTYHYLNPDGTPQSSISATGTSGGDSNKNSDPSALISIRQYQHQQCIPRSLFTALTYFVNRPDHINECLYNAYYPHVISAFFGRIKAVGPDSGSSTNTSSNQNALFSTPDQFLLFSELHASNPSLHLLKTLIRRIKRDLSVPLSALESTREQAKQRSADHNVVSVSEDNHSNADTSEHPPTTSTPFTGTSGTGATGAFSVADSQAQHYNAEAQKDPAASSLSKEKAGKAIWRRLGRFLVLSGVFWMPSFPYSLNTVYIVHYLLQQELLPIKSLINKKNDRYTLWGTFLRMILSSTPELHFYYDHHGVPPRVTQDEGSTSQPCTVPLYHEESVLSILKLIMVYAQDASCPPISRCAPRSQCDYGSAAPFCSASTHQDIEHIIHHPHEEAYRDIQRDVSHDDDDDHPHDSSASMLHDSSHSIPSQTRSSTSNDSSSAQEGSQSTNLRPRVHHKRQGSDFGASPRRGSSIREFPPLDSDDESRPHHLESPPRPPVISLTPTAGGSGVTSPHAVGFSSRHEAFHRGVSTSRVHINGNEKTESFEAVRRSSIVSHQSDQLGTSSRAYQNHSHNYNTSSSSNLEGPSNSQSITGSSSSSVSGMLLTNTHVATAPISSLSASASSSASHHAEEPLAEPAFKPQFSQSVKLITVEPSIRTGLGQDLHPSHLPPLEIPASPSRREHHGRNFHSPNAAKYRRGSTGSVFSTDSVAATPRNGMSRGLGTGNGNGDTTKPHGQLLASGQQAKLQQAKQRSRLNPFCCELSFEKFVQLLVLVSHQYTAISTVDIISSFLSEYIVISTKTSNSATTNSLHQYNAPNDAAGSGRPTIMRQQSEFISSSGGVLSSSKQLNPPQLAITSTNTTAYSQTTSTYHSYNNSTGILNAPPQPLSFDSSILNLVHIFKTHISPSVYTASYSHMMTTGTSIQHQQQGGSASSPTKPSSHPQHSQIYHCFNIFKRLQPSFTRLYTPKFLDTFHILVVIDALTVDRQHTPESFADLLNHLSPDSTYKSSSFILSVLNIIMERYELPFNPRLLLFFLTLFNNQSDPNSITLPSMDKVSVEDYQQENILHFKKSFKISREQCQNFLSLCYRYSLSIGSVLYTFPRQTEYKNVADYCKSFDYYAQLLLTFLIGSVVDSDYMCGTLQRVSTALVSPQSQKRGISPAMPGIPETDIEHEHCTILPSAPFDEDAENQYSAEDGYDAVAGSPVSPLNEPDVMDSDDSQYPTRLSEVMVMKKLLYQLFLPVNNPYFYHKQQKIATEQLVAASTAPSSFATALLKDSLGGSSYFSTYSHNKTSVTADGQSSGLWDFTASSKVEEYPTPFYTLFLSPSLINQCIAILEFATMAHQNPNLGGGVRLAPIGSILSGSTASRKPTYPQLYLTTSLMEKIICFRIACQSVPNSTIFGADFTALFSRFLTAIDDYLCTAPLIVSTKTYYIRTPLDGSAPNYPLVFQSPNYTNLGSSASSSSAAQNSSIYLIPLMYYTFTSFQFINISDLCSTVVNIADAVEYPSKYPHLYEKRIELVTNVSPIPTLSAAHSLGRISFSTLPLEYPHSSEAMQLPDHPYETIPHDDKQNEAYTIPLIQLFFRFLFSNPDTIFEQLLHDRKHSMDEMYYNALSVFLRIFHTHTISLQPAFAIHVPSGYASLMDTDRIRIAGDRLNSPLNPQRSLISASPPAGIRSIAGEQSEFGQASTDPRHGAFTSPTKTRTLTQSDTVSTYEPNDLLESPKAGHHGDEDQFTTDLSSENWAGASLGLTLNAPDFVDSESTSYSGLEFETTPDAMRTSLQMRHQGNSMFFSSHSSSQSPTLSSSSLSCPSHFPIFPPFQPVRLEDDKFYDVKLFNALLKGKMNAYTIKVVLLLLANDLLDLSTQIAMLNDELYADFFFFFSPQSATMSMGDGGEMGLGNAFPGDNGSSFGLVNKVVGDELSNSFRPSTMTASIQEEDPSHENENIFSDDPFQMNRRASIAASVLSSQSVLSTYHQRQDLHEALAEEHGFIKDPLSANRFGKISHVDPLTQVIIMLFYYRHSHTHYYTTSPTCTAQQSAAAVSETTTPPPVDSQRPPITDYLSLNESLSGEEEVNSIELFKILFEYSGRFGFKYDVDTALFFLLRFSSNRLTTYTKDVFKLIVEDYHINEKYDLISFHPRVIGGLFRPSLRHCNSQLAHYVAQCERDSAISQRQHRKQVQKLTGGRVGTIATPTLATIPSGLRASSTLALTRTNSTISRMSGIGLAGLPVLALSRSSTMSISRDSVITLPHLPGGDGMRQSMIGGYAPSVIAANPHQLNDTAQPHLADVVPSPTAGGIVFNSITVFMIQYLLVHPHVSVDASHSDFLEHISLELLLTTHNSYININQYNIESIHALLAVGIPPMLKPHQNNPLSDVLLPSEQFSKTSVMDYDAGQQQPFASSSSPLPGDSIDSYLHTVKLVDQYSDGASDRLRDKHFMNHLGYTVERFFDHLLFNHTTLPAFLKYDHSLKDLIDRTILLLVNYQMEPNFQSCIRYHTALHALAHHQSPVCVNAVFGYPVLSTLEQNYCKTLSLEEFITHRYNGTLHNFRTSKDTIIQAIYNNDPEVSHLMHISVVDYVREQYNQGDDLWSVIFFGRRIPSPQQIAAFQHVSLHTFISNNYSDIIPLLEAPPREINWAVADKNRNYQQSEVFLDLVDAGSSTDKSTQYFDATTGLLWYILQNVAFPATEDIQLLLATYSPEPPLPEDGFAPDSSRVVLSRVKPINAHVDYKKNLTTNPMGKLFRTVIMEAAMRRWHGVIFNLLIKKIGVQTVLTQTTGAAEHSIAFTQILYRHVLAPFYSYITTNDFNSSLKPDSRNEVIQRHGKTPRTQPRRKSNTAGAGDQPMPPVWVVDYVAMSPTNAMSYIQQFETILYAPDVVQLIFWSYFKKYIKLVLYVVALIGLFYTLFIFDGGVSENSSLFENVAPDETADLADMTASIVDSLD